MPAAPTLGYYAVVMTWPAGNVNDVDLYVRDPEGKIAYFAGLSAGLMHLEQDDLGATTECAGVKSCGRLPNSERTIIRGIVPGEYVVDVHMYTQYNSAPTPVTISLWSLQEAVPVLRRTVTLRQQGQWRTAFRFTLSAAGKVTHHDEIPLNIVYVQ